MNAQQEGSKQDLTYLDPETNERYLPYVVEPAVGVDRLFLAILANGYEREQVGENDVREVLRLAPKLAPIKVAVLPLVKKLNADAEAVFAQLCEEFDVEFDSAGKIGKRYRRYDAIGVPWCVTFDYDSLEDGCVTVRDRDTMEQSRVAISDLNTYFRNLI